MIGLDTNVIVRLLVQDDSEQVRRARSAIDKHCAADDPAVVNNVVLVEVVWVLSSVYQYSRAEIVDALEKLLQIKEIAVKNPDEAWEALHLYRDSKADFADHFISVLNREDGCLTTLTFDSKAARSGLFKIID